MTEDKRFVVEKYSIRDMSIDEKYVNSSYYIGDKGIAQRLCDLLNEQHETIERLKQNIDELLSVDIEEELLKENEQLKSDVYDWKASAEDYLKLGKSLKKENEQLKKEVEYWKQVASQYNNELNTFEHCKKYKTECKDIYWSSD